MSLFRKSIISRCMSVLSDTRPLDYTPRRCVLYVPGDDERKLRKSQSLNADCVVLDCEDGVAINRKEEARKTIKKMLDELSFKRTEKAVRINSVDSGMADEDLSVIFEARSLPSCLMIPKVERTEHIDWITTTLASVMKTRKAQGGDVGKLKLGLFVESARSLLDLDQICFHSHQSGGELYKLEVLVFGSDDFCANIGAERSEEARELMYARQRVVTVAKAHGLQAVDLVHINYKDLEGLRTQSAEGRRMGFTGKQVIHPDQIPIVQQQFSPSKEKLAWAEGLIEAFHTHQQSGKGAFTYHGAMIDKPLLLQAENIVAMGRVMAETEVT